MMLACEVLSSTLYLTDENSRYRLFQEWTRAIEQNLLNLIKPNQIFICPVHGL